jgi:hypothetical protein
MRIRNREDTGITREAERVCARPLRTHDLITT